MHGLMQIPTERVRFNSSTLREVSHYTCGSSESGSSQATGRLLVHLFRICIWPNGHSLATLGGRAVIRKVWSALEELLRDICTTISTRSSEQGTRRTLQQSTKCLLHVGCVPRRGLHKRQSIRLRKGTCFRGGDRPEVDEVALVPEKDQAGLRRDLPDVGDPPRHILERFAVCDVVNDDDAVCAAIRCVRDDPEALLARFKECE
jgi:hypothetical protein